MSKILVIIESPGKVQKIQSILGSNYIVKPTVGHITHIQRKPFGIDLSNFNATYLWNTSRSECKGKDDKSKVLKELKEAASKAKDIYFATDPDRAGERIAADAARYLGVKSPKRLLFNEITKTAIMNAIKNPEVLNINYLSAQKTQESLDYLIGFKVSPVMSKFFNTFGLGAGRCMSVYTEIIYDNQKEIDAFRPESSNLYSVSCNYTWNKTMFNNQDIKQDINQDINQNLVNTIEFTGSLNRDITKPELEQFIQDSVDYDHIIMNLTSKEQLVYPHAPLTTLEMQKIASGSLGFSSKLTMQYAQKLYEKGKISYIRTDSVLLPDEILKSTKEFIDKNYPGYSNQKQYQSKMKTAQEGHSAIYPIHVEEDPNLEGGELKLYNLIKNYTLASQMKPERRQVFSFNVVLNDGKEKVFKTKKSKASKKGKKETEESQEIIQESIQEETTETNTEINQNSDEDFLYYKATLSTQTFNGWKILFNEKEQKYSLDILNQLQNNDVVNPIYLDSKQNISRPPTHYSEREFISKVEKLEIGRPSTMATLIDKIQKCKYVEKKNIKGKKMKMNKIQFNYSNNEYTEQNEDIMIGEEKNKFVITPLGVKTTEYLLGYFKNIMDYNFTADMENRLSLIADGQDTYYQTMKFFYDILKQNLDEADKNLPDIRSEDDIVIGQYEGNDVLLKDGKFGLYMVCNKNRCTLSGVDLTKEQIINGGMDQSIITKLFDNKLHPERNAFCIYKDKPALLKTGQFGDYVQWNGKNISIPKDLEKTEQNIINLIKSREPLKEFECGCILNGPYGIYIKDKTNPRKMVSIPADLDIKSIDENKAKELLDSWVNKYAKKTGGKASKKIMTDKTNETKSNGTKKAGTKKASGTGIKKASGTSAKKASGTSAKKASGTSAKKASGTGTKKASGTGTKKASGTGTKKASGTGTRKTAGTVAKKASGTAAKKTT